MNTLTEREQEFIKGFLRANGCGAKNSKELLDDNFSCQCIDDLRDIFPEMTKKQIGGFLASLQEKCVISVEDERGRGEPDLYWVNDSFLEKNIDLSF